MEAALAYRRIALERPERPVAGLGDTSGRFREVVPSPESRSAALAAFEPFVESVASTGRAPGEARDLVLTLWGAIHGLVHLELQGYFDFEPSSRQRIIDVVKGLVNHVR